MFDAGLPGVEDNICKACHDQVGTLYHRCCGCSATEKLMEHSNRHKDILDIARSALHHDLPLFQYGVPWMCKPSKPPNFVARWCGGVEVEDPTFTGNVYSDGSVIGGCRRGDERRGWAAVCIDEQGKVRFGIYGTCPDHFPTSLRAELWALLQVLRHSCPPVTIWIDNAGVVAGFGKGGQWCVAACRPAADLWALIWDKVDDLGGSGISVAKVKAHATEADIQAGRSTPLQMAGNDHADHFAKRGAALAEHISSTASSRQSYLMAQRWYQWLAVLVSTWPSDTQRHRQSARSRKRKRSAREGDAEVVALDSDAVDEANKEAADEAAEEVNEEEALPVAKGAMVSPGDAARQGTVRFGPGHILYRSGPMFWCGICGAYAELRLKSLKQPCTGGAGKGPRAGQLARLRNGMHPLRPRERMLPPVRVAG